MSSKLSRFLSKVTPSKRSSLPALPNGNTPNHKDPHYKDFAGTDENNAVKNQNGDTTLAHHGSSRKRDRTLSLTEEKVARKAARDIQDRQAEQDRRDEAAKVYLHVSCNCFRVPLNHHLATFRTHCMQIMEILNSTNGDKTEVCYPYIKVTQFNSLNRYQLRL